MNRHTKKLLCESKQFQAEEAYNKNYNYQIHIEATKGRSLQYGSALYHDAMALCGSPYYKMSDRRWNSAAIDFLTLFS